MPRHNLDDLKQRLGREAEAVCRHYLSSGKRQGHYWQVGDVHNTPGRSLFVRLRQKASKPAGNWIDAATGEHGDLLDIIRASTSLTAFADVVTEAQRFLRLPKLEPRQQTRAKSGSIDTIASARRLIGLSGPVVGTLAEVWLQQRGITRLNDLSALNFHPRCYHVLDGEGQRSAWPALIGTVTDEAGNTTGAHRTWLTRDGLAKAPVDPQRKSMGAILGHGIRFGWPIGGHANDVMAAGEGIETVLSIREVLPCLPIIAALSANHLAAIRFPKGLARLYIIHDNDASGCMAAKTLIERAAASVIEAIVLKPVKGDFNDDLLAFGLDALRASLRVQLAPQDVHRFMQFAD